MTSRLALVVAPLVALAAAMGHPGSPAQNNLCDCPTNTSCGCCAHLYLNDSVIHINDTACVDVAFEETQLDFDLDIKLNGEKIYEDVLPLSGLKKECIGLPHPFKKDAEICVDFDHILLNTSYVGACAKILVEVVHIKVLSIDAGCFHFHL